MKSKLSILLILLLATPSAFAIGDIAVGPYFGMAMPIANDLVKPGTMFGAQVKVSLVPMVGLGAYYSTRSYGAPTVEIGGVDHEGSKSDVMAFGATAFFGKTGSMPGANFFLAASFGAYKWDSEYYSGNNADTRTSFSVGPGIELILPVKLSIEARGLIELASSAEDEITEKRSSWKSFQWFIGVNYHIGLGPGM
jgi:hypothetical protein